jgi:hypothetical protein
MVTVLPHMEVMTFNGWKKAKDISNGDTVATLESDNYLKYVKVKRIYPTKYRGKIMRIKNQHINVCFEKSRTYLHKPIYNTFYMFNRVPKLDHTLHNLDNLKNNYHGNYSHNTWLEFLAIFIERGEIVRYNNTVSIIIKLNIYKRLDIINTVKCMNLEYKCHQNLLIISSDIKRNNSIFHEYHRYYKSKQHKYLPYMAWFLTKQHSDKLLKTLVDYNNVTIRKIPKERPNQYYISNDSKMIGQIEKLAFYAGYVTHSDKIYSIKRGNRYIIAGTNLLNDTVDSATNRLIIEDYGAIDPVVSNTDISYEKYDSILYKMDLSAIKPIYVRTNMYSRPVWI